MAASLLEIFSLMNDPTLTQKAQAACLSASVAIKYEDPGTANHVNRLLWAQSALIDPVREAPRALRYLIAAAAADGKTSVEIQDLIDATFQNYVNASVDVLSQN